MLLSCVLSPISMWFTISYILCQTDNPRSEEHIVKILWFFFSTNTYDTECTQHEWSISLRLFFVIVVGSFHFKHISLSLSYFIISPLSYHRQWNGKISNVTRCEASWIHSIIQCNLVLANCFDTGGQFYDNTSISILILFPIRSGPISIVYILGSLFNCIII